MKNKYIKVSHISELKFREIVKLFSKDLSATQIAEITGLNRNTINRYLMLFRERIVIICNEDSPLFDKIEMNEFAYRSSKIYEKKKRDTRDKIIVFGLLKIEGKVYTKIIPNVTKSTLQKIVQGKINPDNVVHSSSWHGHHGFVGVGCNKHFRMYHNKNKFVKGTSYINSIESFWSYAKIRLVKFHGVGQKTFNLHLKECEFRFNNKDKNLYKLLLKIFRKNPLN